jgi:predicted acetyltransferase
MTNIIRPCTEEDIESILQIDAYAYSFPESSLERFRENLGRIYQECYIHLHDDVPTAVARVHPFRQNIRGQMKKMAGIGMVSSVPEFRRQGFVHSMILKIMQDLNSKGYATSTLYPFKDLFYGSLGYAKMPPTQMLELNPRNFAHIERPHGYTVKREEGESAIAAWRQLHEHVIHQTHGAVERSENRWKEKAANIRSKMVIARNPQNNPEGFMYYSIKGYGEGHSWAEIGEISVIEALWSTLEGRDALFSYLYGHADQIIKAKIMISPRTDDYYHWASGIHTPKTTGHIVSMARIINVEESFNGLSAMQEGDALVTVNDANCEWNNGTYKITQNRGVLDAKKVDEICSNILSIEGLTSLLYGTLNQDQLKRLGWLKGELPSEFVQWFPKATPWLSEDF